MKVIYRYDLEEVPEQEPQMPRGAQILKIARQTRFPMSMSLWALVDTDNPMVARKIIWIGTGHPGEYNGETYISTYQEANGYVWHFFDGGELEISS